jgi:LuxR family maltose regulon positive regulatory protein
MVHDLHLRAAAWYESSDMPGQAVDHILEAGETEQATELIVQAVYDPLMRGETGVVLRWYEALPDVLIRTHPLLAITYGEALLIAGRNDEAMAYVNCVEASLAELGEHQAALISQVAAVRAYVATLSGDLDEGILQVQRAMAHLPTEDRFLQAVVMWLLGFMQYFRGGVEDPENVLGTTLEISRASDNQLIMALSIYVSALMHVMKGHLRTASQMTERAMGVVMVRAPRWQEGPSPAVSMIDQVLAEIARERNDLSAARIHIDRCVHLAEMWGNAEILADSYVLQARICEAIGDIPAMRRALAAATDMVGRAELAPLTIRQVDAYAARLHLYRGDLAFASQWVETWHEAYGGELCGAPGVTIFVQWIELATAGRVYLTRGQYADVIRYVVPLLQCTVEGGWFGIAISLAAMQALAFQGQGDVRAALASLNQALAWAEPEGYVRSFVDFGLPMTQLLRQVQSSGLYDDYVRELLVALEVAVARRPEWTALASVQHPIVMPATTTELVEPLSERELDVLRLIARGLTNREIAEQLYIAVSTVKSHINNLYGKLAVSNRAHAVARAGDLELL